MVGKTVSDLATDAIWRVERLESANSGVEEDRFVHLVLVHGWLLGARKAKVPFVRASFHDDEVAVGGTIPVHELGDVALAKADLLVFLEPF